MEWFWYWDFDTNDFDTNCITHFLLFLLVLCLKSLVLNDFPLFSKSPADFNVHFFFFTKCGVYQGHIYMALQQILFHEFQSRN